MNDETLRQVAINLGNSSIKCEAIYGQVDIQTHGAPVQ